VSVMERIVIFVVAVSATLGGLRVGADEIDFRRDIRPILSEHCFQCHGPDSNQREAELRLDTHEGALSAITAGSLSDSELIARILSDDVDAVMPPPEQKRPLTTSQKELLSRWVEAGAEWDSHWAFDAIATPTVPAGSIFSDDVHSRNPIDAFVQQQLNGSGLQPAAAANRATLIRRLSLDLTGLPPTPSEIRRFTNDRRPDAYSRLVNRILASPEFGERMAWDWLDAARYADSNGYQGDGDRTMWPWRDWVVKSINGNLPFDEFTTKQLAGDLLSEASEEDRLATGFCRNHMINGEGGRIAEENRIDYVMDMTETAGTVWMGLTLNCCRCHDHKFDPLTQSNYYQLFDFFNQTPVNGGGGSGQTAPVLTSASMDQKELERQLANQLTQKRSEQAEREKFVLTEQQDWEATKLASLKANAAWTPANVVEATAVSQTLRVLDDLTVLAEGEPASKDDYQLKLKTSLTKLTGFRLDALRHSSHTENSLSRAGSGNFVLTDVALQIDVQIDNDGVNANGGNANGANDKKTNVVIASAQATFEQGGHSIANAFDQDPASGWAVYAGKVVDQEHSAAFTFREPVSVAAESDIQLSLKFQSPHDRHVIGRFRISFTSAAKPALTDNNQLLLTALQAGPDERTKEQKESVRTARLADDAPYQQLAAATKNLTDQLNGLRGRFPKVMVMEDMPKRRDTFILNRGLYNDVTDVQVSAAVPSFLPQLKLDRPANRLDLANWIVADENPLTARVVVNRYWQQIFGVGIVKTVEDLGTQGEMPGNRALLDWLADDFRSSGWDVKHLMRTIVTSHTYRQSSRVTEQHQSIDPENRLLSRGSRYRLPSWMIRDQALFVSGLLVESTGGPPVKSYQPPGVWADATFGRKVYNQDTGAALYRRSLYTFWRRIIGPTMFFDNANRQTCTVQAFRTNTPLQALYTLNDVTYVEASRVMARRILADATLKTEAERLDDIYLRVLGRSPSDVETKIWLVAIARSRIQFEATPQAATDLLSIGELPRDESLVAAEHAAWTALILAVLNLDESLNRQ
jgi:hypothetical protein